MDSSDEFKQHKARLALASNALAYKKWFLGDGDSCGKIYYLVKTIPGLQLINSGIEKENSTETGRLEATLASPKVEVTLALCPVQGGKIHYQRDFSMLEPQEGKTGVILTGPWGAWNWLQDISEFHGLRLDYNSTFTGSRMNIPKNQKISLTGDFDFNRYLDVCKHVEVVDYLLRSHQDMNAD